MNFIKWVEQPSNQSHFLPFTAFVALPDGTHTTHFSFTYKTTELPPQHKLAVIRKQNKSIALPPTELLPQRNFCCSPFRTRKLFSSVTLWRTVSYFGWFGAFPLSWFNIYLKHLMPWSSHNIICVNVYWRSNRSSLDCGHEIGTCFLCWMKKKNSCNRHLSIHG